jgi:hypothetical protein
MMEELFTLESLLSLQGAALASWIVPNVLGYIIGIKFNKLRKYFSLLISFSLAFLIATISKVSWTGWIVAIFNGFLIFASAVGINQITMSPEKTQEKNSRKKLMDAIEKPKKNKKQFFSNWF